MRRREPQADYDWYNNLALYYTSDGKLWRVLWDHWKVSNDQVTDYTKLAGREFFYNGARQRYIVRDADPNNSWAPASDWDWTDYSGQVPYQAAKLERSWGLLKAMYSGEPRPLAAALERVARELPLAPLRKLYCTQGVTA